MISAIPSIIRIENLVLYKYSTDEEITDLDAGRPLELPDSSWILPVENWRFHV
jgi:hypothetical protein